MELAISIIISTYNRKQNLEVVLNALKFCNYDSFEVLVVNGPSDDGTEELLHAYKDRVVVLSCAELNLSKSRNIGLAKAQGEIIAFIDDDAIPEPDWLPLLADAFSDQQVGAVGGFIRDHTGVSFQTRFVVVDRLGRAEALDSIQGTDWNVHGGHDRFLSLTGTNCAFRRTALEKVGGFDEAFAYFLDETDLDLRIADAGYKVLVVPDAEIHHKYAESHIRDTKKTAKTMLPTSRSIAYFAMRHGKKPYGLRRVVEYLRRFEQNEIGFKTGNLLAGDITATMYANLVSEVQIGLRQGIDLSYQAPMIPAVKQLEAITPLRRFNPPRKGRGIKLCMFSQDHGHPLPGGIGRWTRSVAKGLASRGHQVTVIGKSHIKTHTVDFTVDSFWSHQIVTQSWSDIEWQDTLGLPKSAANYCLSVAAEARRVNPRRAFDVFSTPIWDIEGACFIGSSNQRTVLSLHTTVGLMLDSKPEWTANQKYFQNHVVKMISAERAALVNAHTILANSEAIVSDIENFYKVNIRDERLAVVPHGVPDISAECLNTRRRWIEQRKALDGKESNGGTVRILFVGRLEKRKGLHQLLAAIPAVLATAPEAEFVLVGQPCDSDLHKQVVSTCDTSRGRVRYLGPLSEEDLLQSYAEADIFVAPSEYESFGLIYLDAMRFEIPCVGCNAGGVPEVIIHDHTGLVVLVNDFEGLAKALVELVKDREKREIFGKNARKRYEERYSDDAMIDSIEKVYM